MVDPTHVIVHMKKAVCFPVLGRKTGAVCRTACGRRLLFARDGSTEKSARLVGMFDSFGHAFRTAVDTVTHVQKRMIAGVEALKQQDAAVSVFSDLARGRGLGEPGRFRYVSLAAADYADSLSAWPRPDGEVIAQTVPAAGFLTSPDDSLCGPFRQYGVLWPNGRFARPGSTHVISFVRQTGIVIAGLLPERLVFEHSVRMTSRWADSWDPGEPSESAKLAAKNVLEHGGGIRRSFERVSFDSLAWSGLSRPALSRSAFDERGECVPRPAPGRRIWHDGFDREGVAVPVLETALMAFFMPGPKR
jgi:hypothetical protein